MSVKDTQLEIMQRQLVEHRHHEQRGLLLLKLGFLLTFLLYLLFNQHLYLGDALSWSSYFKDPASILGFSFTLLIVVLMALFLSWVKHHAYLHFGFFGSVTIVVCTVIGFALFAEFFSSSANQDVKASVLLERNRAYQATLNHEVGDTANTNTGLVLSIANAEQKLARCEANLKAGKEKHCDGDRAKVAALRASEVAANKINAEADIQRDKLKYERQDALKAESYNPVILTLARALAGKNEDYKNYLKTAVVVITLFVAICFEILHHFLSKAHGLSIAAIEGLELSIAKYNSQAETLAPVNYTTIKPLETESTKQPMGFSFNTPTPESSITYTDRKPILFKYQVKSLDENNETNVRQPMGFSFPSMLSKTPTIAAQLSTQEEQLPLPNLGSFKARQDVFASPALSEDETPSKPRARAFKEVLTETPSEPRARGDNGLFSEWVAAVRTGECKPTSDPTWLWIQKRIAPKETGSRTHDRTRIRRMQQAFFARAMKEGLMVLNPNYKNGGKKYLWIA